MMEFNIDKEDKQYSFGSDPDEIKKARQGAYNKKVKRTMKFIGENLATYAVILATMVLVGSVFGELSFNFFFAHMVPDFILTVSTFMLVEYLLSQNGVGCGKTYDGYIMIHNKYLEMREGVFKRGIALMDIFCTWQVDIEYEYYIRGACKELEIGYDDYINTYSKMSLQELNALFDHIDNETTLFNLKHPIASLFKVFRRAKHTDKATRIFSLRLVKRITLTPEILLTDGKPRRSRGGVGISGEEYIEKKTVGGGHIAITILTALISVLPTIALKEWSWLLLFYALLKLIGVFFRGSRGYANGVKAFNTIDVKRLSDQMQYLNLYNEFLDKKIYLQLDGKYGSVPVAYMCEDDIKHPEQPASDCMEASDTNETAGSLEQ